MYPTSPREHTFTYNFNFFFNYSNGTRLDLQYIFLKNINYISIFKKIFQLNFFETEIINFVNDMSRVNLWFIHFFFPFCIDTITTSMVYSVFHLVFSVLRWVHRQRIFRDWNSQLYNTRVIYIDFLTLFTTNHCFIHMLGFGMI